MSNEIGIPLHRHILAMKQVARSIEQYSPAIIEIGEKMRPAVENYAAIQKAIVEAMEPLRGNAQHIAQIVKVASASTFTPEIFSQIEETRNIFKAIVLPDLEQFIHGFQTLPSRTKDALLVLGKNGWYLDFSMSVPDVWRLQGIFESDKPEDAESWLCEYYEQEFDKIKNRLLRCHPERSKIIAAAFDAHTRGEYELSIPVIIAQADGLCKQAVGVHYFIRKSGRPATASHVEKMAAESIAHALLSPLATTLPLGESAWDRDPDSPGLNRHHLLHGESLNYGNRENSLRAISFINYVSGALYEE